MREEILATGIGVEGGLELAFEGGALVADEEFLLNLEVFLLHLRIPLADMVDDLALILPPEEGLEGVGLQEALHAGLDDLRRSHMEDQRALQVYPTDEMRHQIE